MVRNILIAVFIFLVSLSLSLILQDKFIMMSGVFVALFFAYNTMKLWLIAKHGNYVETAVKCTEISKYGYRNQHKKVLFVVLNSSDELTFEMIDTTNRYRKDGNYRMIFSTAKGTKQTFCGNNLILSEKIMKELNK